MNIPRNITKEHILLAIQDIESNGIKYPLTKSKKYDLVFNGKKYPPKYTISIANQFANGSYLPFTEFNTYQAQAYLKNLSPDFVIKEKENDSVAELIERYKKHISANGLKDEIYKWKLLAQFQGRPDITKPDFTEELKSINFSNLVYPVGITVINHIAKERAEPYRECFKVLFNEEKPLFERIKYFNEETLKIFRELVPEEKLSHHQDERTIATFLTYHNPEKYSFYKDSFYQKACKLFDVQVKPKGEKYVHYLELIDDFINEYISEDWELLELITPLINSPDYFQDKNHKILAQDILFQTLDHQIGFDRAYWRIGTTDGASGRATSYWEDMKTNNNVCIGWRELGDLNDAEISAKKNIESLFKKEGFYTGDNRTLSRKAGEVFNFYSNIKVGDVVLAQIGVTILGIGIITDEYFFDNNFDFPHQKPTEWKIFNPKITNKEGLQTTVFKLTDVNVIKQIDDLLKSNVTSFISSTNKAQMKLPLNQILFGPPGTGKTFKLQTEFYNKFIINDNKQSKEEYTAERISALAWWQVFAIILLEGELTVPQIKKHSYVQYKLLVSNTRSLDQTVWGQLSSHTVIDSKTVSYTSRFEPLFFNKKDDSVWYIEETKKELISDLIELKNQIKSYNNDSFKVEYNCKFTTFHQSMTYEDFIEGIKPVFKDSESDGMVDYKIEKGIFYRSCDEAAKLAGFINLKDAIYNYSKSVRKDKFKNAPPFGLFIDEINRGNVSSIFGELITLVEDDKRLGENEILVELPYSKEKFGVPSNLYIIGTMNTADRSVEAIDTALRRRFSFEEVPPNYDLKELKYEISGFKGSEILLTINKRIEKLLDKDHLIGHSYFMIRDGENPEEWLINSFYKNIIPLLQEYFFGDYGKIGLVLGRGFVQMKEWNKDSDGFADFDYDNYNEFEERPVYEIIDYRNIDKDNESFGEAIRILMKK